MFLTFDLSVLYSPMRPMMTNHQGADHIVMFAPGQDIHSFLLPNYVSSLAIFIFQIIFYFSYFSYFILHTVLSIFQSEIL